MSRYADYTEPDIILDIK